MLAGILIALLLVLGVSAVVTKLLEQLAKFYERMDRYGALMDEAEELEPTKEDEQ